MVVLAAAAAAPEIDRLVLSVNREVGRKHSAPLLEMAYERELDSLDLLPHLGDFLLTGEITREQALLRMRYWPPERVLGRLDELENKQLIQHTGPALAATNALKPLLEALLAAHADVAAEAWRGCDADVSAASRVAREIGMSASDEHVVAVAHRALPEPADPYLRLHGRLVTLRYVRQHDHAMAWMARDLAAPTIVAMTQLWQGGDVEAPSQGLTHLVELGFATDDPPALTDHGRLVREMIEADTNTRAQATFNAVGGEVATAFVDAVRRLPGH